MAGGTASAASAAAEDRRINARRVFFRMVEVARA
jgi:hypothetical protein